MQHALAKILILILGISAIYGAIVFYFDWRIPRATASVLIHPAMVEKIKMVPYEDSSGETHYMTRSSFETPSEKLFSAATLFLAARRAGLKASDDENVTLLKKIVTITPREGTDLIGITVKRAPKEEAIRIATAIAEVGAERLQWVEDHQAEQALETPNEK